MRVALLGPYAGAQGEPSLAGGVDAVVLTLAQALACRPGVELHVVTSVPGLRAAEQLTYSGLVLHRLPYPRGDRLLWHQPTVWPLKRALADIAPDVVHAHMAGPFADAALQVARAGRRAGPPAVVTLHGVVFREAALVLADSPLGSRLRWFLDAAYERWILRRTRDLIAISPYVSTEYRPLTRARFHDIENPVADRYFELPEPAGVGASPLILCVARLIPRKDILTLIEAFGRIRAAIPGAHLEIAGQADANPAYTAACRQAVERLRLTDAVRFLGGIGGQALADCYGRAGIVMLTSRQETAPVVIAEAMAAARPVVATRTGGVPFMVTEGHTGWLAEVGDAPALADAAIALLRDPAQRCAFGKAARLIAGSRFRLTAVVDRTLALYAGLIAERAQAVRHG